MPPVSDIKLIRTDTTLDLSQKAEKGMPYTMPMWGDYERRGGSAMCAVRVSKYECPGTIRPSTALSNV